MAWIVDTLTTPFIVGWTQASIDDIVAENAAVVAPYARLPCDHPEYIEETDSPVGHRRPALTRQWEAVVEDYSGPLPDALSMTKVNDRVKRLVEALEPGVHQFRPMTLTMADGTKPDGWWNMQCCNRIDAVAEESCIEVYRYHPRPNDWPNWFYYLSDLDSRTRVSVHRDRIRGMSFWYDWRMQHYFFSEALGQAIVDQGIQGFTVPNDGLGRSRHVTEV